MKKEIISRKSKAASIDKRIEKFIKEIAGLPQKGSQINSRVRTEKRWLGIIEGDGQGYAIRSVKTYLTRYRAAISERLPFDYRYKKALDKVLDKHGKSGLLKELSNAVKPSDALLIIKKIRQEALKTKPTLYEAVSKLTPTHRAYNLMKLQGNQKDLIATEAKKTVKQKVTNRIIISRSVVESAVEEGIEKNASRSALAVALILCSGRRGIELYKTGSFKALTNGRVRFSGQAKQKGIPADPYEIPILHITAHQFVKNIYTLRKQLKNLENLSHEDIDRKTSGVQCQAARRMLLNDDAFFYTGRKVYAEMCWEKFGEQSNTTKNAYLSDLLGHDEDDLDTSNTYQAIKLVDESLLESKKRYKPENNYPKLRVNPLRFDVEDRGSKYKGRSSNTLAGRLKALQGVAEMEGRAVNRINTWAIGYALENKDAVFTQSMITKELGASRPAIKKWLAISNEVRLS